MPASLEGLSKTQAPPAAGTFREPVGSTICCVLFAFPSAGSCRGQFSVLLVCAQSELRVGHLPLNTPEPVAESRLTR